MHVTIFITHVRNCVMGATQMMCMVHPYFLYASNKGSGESTLDAGVISTKTSCT